MDAIRTTRTPATRRRVVPGLLLVPALLWGSLLAGAGSASAQAAPSAPTPQFPYPHDGCTLVPDAPSGVSFTTACNHHDGCYGVREHSRATCDAIFYREMVAACDASRSTRYYTCRSFASVYYLGVRAFGRPFYDSADPAVRASTPMQT